MDIIITVFPVKFKTVFVAQKVTSVTLVHIIFLLIKKVVNVLSVLLPVYFVKMASVLNANKDSVNYPIQLDSALSAAMFTA